MGLFSFLNKNKQDVKPARAPYRAQADEPFTAPGNARSRPRRAAGADSKDTDPILPEKKRARRRLIGAVVLVLAVIIVLPMILDPEPRPVPDDIAIQIPSRDAKNAAATAKAANAAGLDASEEIVDAGSGKSAADTATAPAPASSAPAAAAPPVAVAPAVVPVTPVAQVAPVAVAPVVKPAERPAPAAAPAMPVEKPVEKPAEKPVEKPAPAHRAEPAVAKPTEEERAMAILQGKPLPAAKAAPAKARPVAGTTPGGKFTIQVAALATQEKIDELRSKLSAAGIASYIQKVATQDGDRTRIRVGPFANHADAEKARARIAKLGLNATVLPN